MKSICTIYPAIMKKQSIIKAHIQITNYYMWVLHTDSVSQSFISSYLDKLNSKE